MKCTEFCGRKKMEIVHHVLKKCNIPVPLIHKHTKHISWALAVLSHYGGLAARICVPQPHNYGVHFF